MNQIPCPDCGTLNRSSVKFCSNCGIALKVSQTVNLVQLSSGRVMNGRYTILQPLGKGGMGAIYLASETIANQERRVVVKEIRGSKGSLIPMVRLKVG